MLSAFTARPIIELRPKEKLRIESVLAYGDRLFVGFNTGGLHAYRLQEQSPSSPSTPTTATDSAVELLRDEEKFSRYKVEQLAFIKELPALVSLSGGLVSFHDPSTYTLQETLNKAKGASVFAVTSNVVKDDDTGVPQIVSRLAVAVKRKLMFWAWKDSEVVDEHPEFALATAVKSLTWVSGTRLVAGLTGSYVLVDVESHAVVDIVGPGSIGGGPGQDSGRFGSVGMGYMGMGGMVPKPLATRLAEGEVLLAKDVNTHFINTEGEALGRRQIPWSAAPDAVGYSYPFLLALSSGKAGAGTLDIRNPETLASLQTLQLPGASMMHVPNPYVSLAHKGKGLIVASDKCIWRMDALGYDDQIEGLFEKGAYDEAISLLGMLEDALLRDKQGRLREAKMLKAQALFDHKKYRDALDLFTDAQAPPQRVISMYPAAISGDLEPADDEDGKSGTGTPKTARTRSDAGDSPKKKRSDLEEAQKERESPEQANGKDETASIAATDFDDTASLLSVAVARNFRRRELQGKELRVAANSLGSFLVDARTKLQKYIDWDGSEKETLETETKAEDEAPIDALMVPYQETDERTRQQKLVDTFKLVDTTLFRVYMLASPSLAGSLFRLPNFCDPEVVQDKLLETKRYMDLIDFLFGKRLHDQALKMLQEFGKKHDDHVPEALRGPQRTVAYLQGLPPDHVDLILRYAEWPITVKPELGMEVFVGDTHNAENLPRDKVVGFLNGIDRKDHRFETWYLEHILHELDDENPVHHQRLIDLYLERIQSAQTDKSEVLDKLLDFLKSSSHYDSWPLLRKMPKDKEDFFEPRAVVLGNMGQHRQALAIYVFDMEAPSKAEEYCNRVYVSETDSSSNNNTTTSTIPQEGSQIYHDLLSLYLSPQPPHEPQFEPALAILAKHGSRLPASSTLALIPESLPVRKLEDYFTHRIRAANKLVNAAKIEAGLRKAVDIEDEVRLRLGRKGRNRNVVVREDRMCGVCHKRFGGSAIKVLPSGEAVHYGCAVR